MVRAYKAGAEVSVFDAERGRWTLAVVLSATRGRVLVAKDRWWALVPPSWLRPIRVVRAA